MKMYTIIRKGESMAEKCAVALVDNGPEWDGFGEHIAKAGARAIATFDHTRHQFPDGSAIVEGHAGWDIGFTQDEIDNLPEWLKDEFEENAIDADFEWPEASPSVMVETKSAAAARFEANLREVAGECLGDQDTAERYVTTTLDEMWDADRGVYEDDDGDCFHEIPAEMTKDGIARSVRV